MDGYLQHLRCLRMHLNDYEDKAAELSAEQYSQQTVIRRIEQDLESVRSESLHLDDEIVQLTRKSGELARSILESAKVVKNLDGESEALSQALELLKADVMNKSSSSKERILYMENYLKDVTSKFQEHKAYYDNRPLARAIQEINTDLKHAQAGDGTMDIIPVSSSGSLGKGKSTSYGIEKMRSKLAEERQKIKEEMLEIEAIKQGAISEIDKMKDTIEQLICKCSSFSEDIRCLDIETLKQELTSVVADKEEEEKYHVLVNENLNQIRTLSENITCKSCGYNYLVELGNAKIKDAMDIEG